MINYSLCIASIGFPSARRIGFKRNASGPVACADLLFALISQQLLRHTFLFLFLPVPAGEEAPSPGSGVARHVLMSLILYFPRFPFDTRQYQTHPSSRPSPQVFRSADWALRRGRVTSACTHMYTASPVWPRCRMITCFLQPAQLLFMYVQ